jgi:alanine dehydrogenase
MIIGCPKEIKAFENRVALIPASVKALVDQGAVVLVQSNAGLGSNICDQDYRQAGALIKNNAQEIWAQADIITKVKEPLEEEFNFFRENQVIYTFLHLAAEPALTKALVSKKVTAIGYETIEENGQLPLLKPMSEVAGRMAVQVGAYCLESQHGGKGILLGGVPGVRRGRVVILGAGVVGKNAAKIALGMGAEVCLLDINPSRLEEMDDLFQGRLQTLYANSHNIEQKILHADLLIGAVLIAGARAPHLVSKAMVQRMEKGSAVVDVAVDQGGCIETVKRTTHDNPTYIQDGIVHYGVANMPGAVATTSTYALSQVTFPYLSLMAKIGVFEAALKNLALRKGINTLGGFITQKAVAEALGQDYHDPANLIAK